MEIPTKEIIEGLMGLEVKLLGDVSQPMARIKTVLDAIDVIKNQRQEIQELQAVIVRLRDEISAMGESQPVDFWAKRRMTAWKALPEPRVSWEDFKRTWKDD